MTVTAYVLLAVLMAMFVVLIGILIKGNGSKKWLNDQFEWFKGFFEETAGQPNRPSHKNLLAIAVVGVFVVSYMRVLAATAATVMPEISNNWLEILLGILIVRSAQSVFETRARIKAERTGISAPTSPTPSLTQQQGEPKS